MIEGAVLERQGERINPLSEPAARSQDTSRFDEVGGEVDRRHPATAFGRQITRRATEAATDIEHASGWSARSAARQRAPDVAPMHAELTRNLSLIRS